MNVAGQAQMVSLPNNVGLQQEYAAIGFSTVKGHITTNKLSSTNQLKYDIHSRHHKDRRHLPGLIYILTMGITIIQYIWGRD